MHPTAFDESIAGGGRNTVAVTEAIRQQTTVQRQELRDLPQASSSRRHPPSRNPLDKGASGVSSNNSSVYSWRPDFAWSATTPKTIDRKGCGGVPKSHNASHGF